MAGERESKESILSACLYIYIYIYIYINNFSSEVNMKMCLVIINYLCFLPFFVCNLSEKCLMLISKSNTFFSWTQKNTKREVSMNKYSLGFYLEFFWLICLMSYQPSWVIQCQSHPCKRTVVVLFNSFLKKVHTFPKGINLKVNVIVQLNSFIIILQSSILPTTL